LAAALGPSSWFCWRKPSARRVGHGLCQWQWHRLASTHQRLASGVCLPPLISIPSQGARDYYAKPAGRRHTLFPRE
jgi:hypothetical protein